MSEKNVTAAAGAIKSGRTGPIEFLSQVRDEGRKVTWPGRKETVVTTAMVFVMVVLASVFFSTVDVAVRHMVAMALG